MRLGALKGPAATLSSKLLEWGGGLPPESCQTVGIGHDRAPFRKGTTAKKKVAVVTAAEAEEAASR